MSYEAALKRLGLSHLKDKPLEAKQAAEKIIQQYSPKPNTTEMTRRMQELGR
jgi:hypothetical protein